MKRKLKIVLALETSCDDTSVALVDNTGFVIGVKSQNQDELHAPYGGVIPEMACRNHTLKVLPLCQELLLETGISFDDLKGLAVTARPGLLGSLLVGVTVAKTLSLIYDLPIVGVNHLEGHLHASFLRDVERSSQDSMGYPFLGLCVSGGHTSLYQVKAFGNYKLLGSTVDDAAGEGFDKFGKILGLGYPAGAKIDALSREGDPRAFTFPRALFKDPKNLDFSFSGLKTAGKLCVDAIIKNQKELSSKTLADLAASYQEAIVDALIEKLKRAAAKTKLKTLVITGGVSANSRLRTKAQEVLGGLGLNVLVPPLRYCTDNAAMIGYVGLQKLLRGEDDGLKLSPQA